MMALDNLVREYKTATEAESKETLMMDILKRVEPYAKKTCYNYLSKGIPHIEIDEIVRDVLSKDLLNAIRLWESHSPGRRTISAPFGKDSTTASSCFRTYFLYVVRSRMGHAFRNRLRKPLPGPELTADLENTIGVGDSESPVGKEVSSRDAISLIKQEFVERVIKERHSLPLQGVDLSSKKLENIIDRIAAGETLWKAVRQEGIVYSKARNKEQSVFKKFQRILRKAPTVKELM